jgi:soluble lytic murein transglycosylase-like protein
LRPFGRYLGVVSEVFTAVPAEPRPTPPPVPPAPTTDAEVRFGTRLSTHLLRHPVRLVVACLASVLGPAVVAQAGSLGVQPPAGGRPAGADAATSVTIPVAGDGTSWIPVARQAAATCPGLPSSVLMAIGHVESKLGLDAGASSAGAVGPMQFLPSTWAAYAADGDGDGRTDVMNPADAVHGAAKLLCANGGGDPALLASALWNYNHSDEYVRLVMTLARFLPTT